MECTAFGQFTSKVWCNGYNAGYPYVGLSLMQITGDRRTESLEHTIMFAYFLEKLGTWFETAERRRREAYLASSSDIVQLEQRIRSIESSGYNSL